MGGLFYVHGRSHCSLRPPQAAPVVRTQITVVRTFHAPPPCDHQAVQPPAAHSHDHGTPKTPDEMLSTAQRAYVDGDYPHAAAFARLALRHKGNPTRVWRIIGSAGCSMQDKHMIEEAIVGLKGKKGDPAGMQYLTYVCQRNGVSLDKKGTIVLPTAAAEAADEDDAFEQ